ncbi:hypothetical protein HZS_7080 [Henneguya salminicola]|nr:hypothetical protein HZS_7080 [Henneguya salminicola]
MDDISKSVFITYPSYLFHKINHIIRSDMFISFRYIIRNGYVENTIMDNIFSAKYKLDEYSIF